MKLHGSFTSPYVRHCRIELSKAGLDYEFIETDYAASAAGSPTKRVPFLSDGSTVLTDSSSILLYIKQCGGQAGFTDSEDFELYSLVNTTMDTEINLFLLSRDGLGPDSSDYLKRQRSRVASGLDRLNEMVAGSRSQNHDYSDGQIRLACLLEWGLFRNRFDLDGRPALQAFLERIRAWPVFAETAPPADA